MDKFREKILKDYDEILFDLDDGVLDVIPTGSLSLDVATGIGGIPKRKITVLYGAEFAGKTTISLNICKKALESGESVLFVDMEQSLDTPYLKSFFGEELLKNFMIIHPKTGEDALSIVELAIDGNKKAGVEGGQFGLIVVDSIAALVPEKELEAELTDSHVGLLSRLLGAFFRRNMYNIYKNNVALLMTNQVRDSIGTYYSSYSLPGGHALKHYSAIIIMLSSGTKIEQGGENIGILSKFVVKKNKLAPPFRSYEVPILFGKGIDEYRDALTFASNMGIVKRRGSYYMFDGVTLGQGMNNSIEYVKENKETLDKIRELCYTSLSTYTTEDEGDD